jgi:rubrerythrin
MLFDRNAHAITPGPLATALIVGALILLAAANVDGIARKSTRPSAPQAPTVTITRDAPNVRDTPANLQAAFNNEINAKERYLAFAKQADLEGYRGVAGLFRACARAEEVHSRRHVEAIALTTVQARAVLERVYVQSTAENLRTAIDAERYEVEQWYPAMIERARADHMSNAVRSMTLAIAAEREHVQLLSAALAGLDQHAAAATYWVCPYCGKTLETTGFTKCPNCFTSVRRFIRVT